MLRTAWLALAAIFVTIPLSSATIVVAIVRSTSPAIDKIVRLWGTLLVKAAGIDLRTENVERIDPDKRYILVANHYSYLDIPCIVAAIPQPIRFMAKVSLFKIPIFGHALERAGFIPIDRKNRRTAVKSFDLAADRIRKGNTIVIFPEEGRTNVREMRPFQRGAFLLALKSEKTIVPLAIDSTFDVFPVGAKRVVPGRVTIRVGTPIETAGRSLRDKEQLLQEARTQIETMLFGAPTTAPASGPTPADTE
ncbi:MAG TPA: lysophospholipid acyltransferase family protein [Thermoanaerobaculia bacterium]|jgi:1-acyl-sn-glycerol-3-phosphate acyltransferase|nr:lysophospholipid acyltransferase family protein [Thermoanaerobaculia bacterium]